MRQRKWNWLSVGRAAVLSRKGATRDQIIEHYLKHYGRKLGIETKQEMEKILFRTILGAVAASPGKMFFGKTPEQIKKTFKEWRVKSQQARQRMAQAHRGVKRGALSSATRARMSAAHKGKKAALAAETKQKKLRTKKSYWKQRKENIPAVARKQAIEKLYKESTVYRELYEQYTKNPENSTLQEKLEKMVQEEMKKKKS